MIVADTCLVFHLFNETSLTTQAQIILDKDPHWILPPLWREEYANILSKLARREKRTAEEIIEQFDVTMKALTDCEVEVDTQHALRISMQYKISVYDAHFMALAISLNTVLVTEDKEILKNCPKLAISIPKHIQKLGIL